MRLQLNSDPLLAAVAQSDLSTVLKLLEAGHSPDVSDDRYTPLTLSLINREAVGENDPMLEMLGDARIRKVTRFSVTPVLGR